MQGWVKDSPEPKVWPHKHFLLCKSKLKNSCLWLPSGCSSSPPHLYIYLGVMLQTSSQKRSLLKNYETSATHTLPGGFRKNPFVKRTLPMHSMDLNALVWSSACPLFCSWLGNVPRQSRSSWYLCADRQCASRSKFQTAHAKRSSCRHLQMNSRRWMPQECLRFVGWYVIHYTGFFHGPFPHPHTVLMLLNSLWLRGMHWLIKDGVFLQVMVYRIYSSSHKIGAIMNGFGMADPSLGRVWH